MADCTVCTRPVIDTGYACWDCTNRLARRLEFITSNAGELDTVITRQARGPARLAGRSADTPLPYQAEASDNAWTIHQTLSTWAKSIVDERGIPAPAPASDALAAFISQQLPWLRCQPDAAAGFDELDYAAWLLRVTIDTRPDLTYLGACNTPTDTGPACDTELRAAKDAKTVTCPSCGARHDVADRRAELLRRVHNMLMTAPEIAAAITAWRGPLPVNTVYSWARRRRLPRRGTDPATGQPRYRLGDALTLAERTPIRQKGPTK